MTQFPEPNDSLDRDRTLRELPPEYPDQTIADEIRAEIVRQRRKVVVLDDDPTGPQAMRDVYTLTDWSIEDLRRELLDWRPLFFVLTNTRALPPAQAVTRAREVSAAVREAARRACVDYALMIRGDSTLRGHFPREEDALGAFDGYVLIPFFAEGGRYTLDDVQWVAEERGHGAVALVPAAQTPYARDVTFGYQHSNLRNWVAEKTAAAGVSSETQSVTLPVLRARGPAAVTEALLLSRRHTTILNAMSYRDLEVAALGLLRAERSGKRFIVRCAASFVRVRAGQSGASEQEVGEEESTAFSETGVPTSPSGLIIVGSHVPKSSVQLKLLLREPHVTATELNVSALHAGNLLGEIQRVSRWMNAVLAGGQNVVIYTSREVEPRGTASGLAIGSVIASALVDIVRRLEQRPRFMIAKGGWTSSEIAIQGLGVRRAYTPMPILPGVPLWRLGPETRFPGLNYVVFPGNVGTDDALVEVARRLSW